MHTHIREDKNRIVRHSMIELIEHWAIALSGLALLLSGLFELPMAARYRITTIPGFSWSGDFITSLSIHYAASVIFIAAALFHLFYHGLAGDRSLLPRRGDLKTSIAVVKTFFGKGEEPPFAKYLPEQRLAYIGMAVIIAFLILSGLVKTYKNVFAPDLSLGLVLWATWLHNIFFVLFILAFVGHIGAILLKPNRPMVRGILTGSVRLDYARHRHPLWLAEMGEPLVSQPVREEEATEPVPVPAESAAESGPPAAAAAESLTPDAESAGPSESVEKKSGEGA